MDFQRLLDHINHLVNFREAVIMLACVMVGTGATRLTTRAGIQSVWRRVQRYGTGRSDATVWLVPAGLALLFVVL